MDVRPGYKQTDVGVIPEDWGYARLDSLGDGKRPPVKAGPFGSTLTKDQYVPVGFKVYGQEQVIAGDPLFGSYYISSKKYRELESCAVQPGDVLLSLVGTIGRLLEIPDGAPLGVINPRLLRLSLDKERVSPKFFKYVFETGTVQSRLERQAQGGTMGVLNAGVLRPFQIPLPELPEQRAIATALSDVDALLGGLDRLVAKKRDLKVAAMQQLLTGQTRLPGFHGEWEAKRLDDHVSFLRNGVNSRAELLPEGRVKYLHYGDVHACRDVYLSPASLPCLPDAKAASLDRLRDGDLILADASEDVAGVSKSVELRGVGNMEVVSGLHTIAARFDKNVLADGFKGFLQYCPPFTTHLRRLAAGTKVYATNRAHVASVEMRLPTVPEQTAIADVLSDMEAEITALEARREKTRDLKLAMMQELLTGKTRLVHSDTVDV
jgi:type I restriction enzyme S subunit